MGKVTEIKKANGEVMRIIDGEYVIGAGSGCFANPSPCRKIIGEEYLIERCINNCSKCFSGKEGGLVYLFESGWECWEELKVLNTEMTLEEFLNGLKYSSQSYNYSGYEECIIGKGIIDHSNSLKEYGCNRDENDGETFDKKFNFLLEEFKQKKLYCKNCETKEEMEYNAFPSGRLIDSEKNEYFFYFYVEENIIKWIVFDELKYK